MAEPKRRDYRWLMLLAVFVLVGIAVATIVLDWREVRRVITEARWYWVAPALAFTALSYFCLSYIFALLNRMFGIGLKTRDLFEIGYVSTVLGHIVSFAGVPQYSLRLVLMKQRGLAVGDILAPSVFGSYLNDLAMLALFPIGITHLLLSQHLSRSEVVGFSVTVFLLAVVLIGAGVVIMSKRARAGVFHWFIRLWLRITHRDVAASVQTFDDALTRGVDMARTRPRTLAVVALLIVGDWTATIVALQFCFVSLGGAIGLGVLLTGFAVGITAGLLSLIPGGLGVQEGSMAGIYFLLGVPFERALLAAILFRVVYYFIPFLFSLPFYRRLLVTNRP